MTNLILIRHGQSEWNAKNQFTGWVDANLSDKGRSEASLAGKLIKDTKINISNSYTSYLKRAKDTLNIILNIINNQNTTITEAWELNERHYGALTGLNKIETKTKLGEEVFNQYRRSWDIAPPSIEKNSIYFSKFSNLNSKIPSEKIPTTESLKNTYERVIPFYRDSIFPQIASGQKVIIAAHGNSIRALCKNLFNITDYKISMLEIPTGNPLCIEFNKNYSSISKAFYLDKKRSKTLYFNE